jgi:hypothetical protein
MKKTNLDILKNIKELKAKEQNLLCELEFSLKCKEILEKIPNSKIVAYNISGYKIIVAQDKLIGLTHYECSHIIAQYTRTLSTFYRNNGKPTKYNKEKSLKYEVVSFEKN